MLLCVQVLASLAGHPDLLHWHLMKHPSSSLSLCITALADDAGEHLLTWPSLLLAVHLQRMACTAPPTLVPSTRLSAATVSPIGALVLR